MELASGALFECVTTFRDATVDGVPFHLTPGDRVTVHGHVQDGWITIKTSSSLVCWCPFPYLRQVFECTASFRDVDNDGVGFELVTMDQVMLCGREVHNGWVSVLTAAKEACWVPLRYLREMS